MLAESASKVSHQQQGLALLMLVFILALIVVGFAVGSLDSAAIQNDRNRKTAAVLAEAKTALIGAVIGRASINDRPYLPNPSLALVANSEGSESLAPLGGAADISLVGKFPWKSLETISYKDGWNECLWYVVSGRYKNTPETSVFNWDTQGQIDVIDKNGNVVASNLAALIIAPGPVLNGQDRALTSADYRQCGGNYDAKNYLDSFNLANAISGEVNYFRGSTNNRVAPDTSNKIFVSANNDYYNDKIISLTTDDIFDPLIKRSDFSDQISALLDDAEFQTHLLGVEISSNKGTDNIDCDVITNLVNKIFCDNWKEMLTFTQLPPPLPSSIMIDGLIVAPCSRVIIFGGKKTGDQVRITSFKDDPENYLEGTNLAAFNTPTANSNDFNGISSFSLGNTSADVLRCL